GMDGRDVRAPRVQDEGGAGGGEGGAVARDLGGEGGVEVAVDVGEVDAGLLEEAAVGEDAGAAAAAAGAVPDVFAERSSVGGRQAGTDPILDVAEEGGGAGVHPVSLGFQPSARRVRSFTPPSWRSTRHAPTHPPGS